MEFEGLICPNCSGSLDEKQLAENLSCPHCGTKFHNKKFIAFIEYLMMNGIVSDIDFFDCAYLANTRKRPYSSVNNSTNKSFSRMGLVCITMALVYVIACN